MSDVTIHVDEKTFKAEVLESDKPVLVDFWASWCMPCKMMEPVLEEVGEQLKDKLKIAKLNTETSETQQIAMLYRIQSIPNMKLFYKGKVVNEFIGYRPTQVFMEELDKALAEIKD